MRDVETVTARGRGHWYHDYEFELLTRSVTRWDSAGSGSQTIDTWEVRIDDERVGSRGFSSAAERDAFLASQFTDVAVTPLQPPIESDRPHVMGDSVGADVASVTFVADYVQLLFDAPGFEPSRLNLYVWPVLDLGDRRLRRPDAGYLDEMVGLIGMALESVDELLDLGLVLEFADGQRLLEPLDGSRLDGGVEVAEFWTSNRCGRVWVRGDEPVDFSRPASS